MQDLRKLLLDDVCRYGLLISHQTSCLAFQTSQKLPECQPRSLWRDSCRVGFEPGEPCDDDEYDDDDDDDDNDDEYDGEYDDEYDDVPGQVCESRDLG